MYRLVIHVNKNSYLFKRYHNESKTCVEFDVVRVQVEHGVMVIKLANDEKNRSLIINLKDVDFAEVIDANETS